jgi:hypothetical protein
MYFMLYFIHSFKKIIYTFSVSYVLLFINILIPIGCVRYQRSKPNIIDPGLYLQKKNWHILGYQDRVVPTPSKLFIGNTLLSLFNYLIDLYQKCSISITQFWCKLTLFSYMFILIFHLFSDVVIYLPSTIIGCESELKMMLTMASCIC